ncbi:nucleotide pyrophosphohydrolase [Desulforhopalus sp. IMCC35007]|nr:nucleotide pyrophosphohydrolase [Desulforhopalus sp. IMCC35007]
MTDNYPNLQQLLETICTLRGENGCPWDKKQTPASLVKYLKAETTELIEAILNNDTANTCEELGDVFYILIMITLHNQELQNFRLADVFSEINEKLIRRHPHVFAGTSYNDESDLERQWKQIKSEEKQKKTI